MSASGKRPLSNRNPAGGSSRRNPPTDALEKRSRTSSGRARPDAEEADNDASAFKKVMFFGTGALILVCLVLLVMKWNVITAPPQKAPPKAVVVDENVQLDALKKEAQTARKMFNDAMRMSDPAAKATALQSAIDYMDKTRQKISDMGDQPKYQTEDFDRVFGPEIDKITLEMREAREAMAKAKAAAKNGGK